MTPSAILASYLTRTGATVYELEAKVGRMVVRRVLRGMQVSRDVAVKLSAVTDVSTMTWLEERNAPYAGTWPGKVSRIGRCACGGRVPELRGKVRVCAGCGAAWSAGVRG